MPAAPLRLASDRALAARRAELAVARSVLGRHHRVVDEDDPAAHRFVGRRLAARRRCRSRPLRPRSRAPASRRYCRARSRPARCGKGETISARSSPRTQTGMSNGSIWTLVKPNAVSRRTAHVRAARLGLGAGLALADLGGEALDQVPGDRVAGQRRVAQRRGAVADRLGGGEGGEGEARAGGAFSSRGSSQGASRTEGAREVVSSPGAGVSRLPRGARRCRSSQRFISHKVWPADSRAR